jgi:hypothetical protein
MTVESAIYFRFELEFDVVERNIEFPGFFASSVTNASIRKGNQTKLNYPTS